MSKYAHLNEQEIVSSIEKFGTDDEKEIVAKLLSEPDWYGCPNCDELDGEVGKLKLKILDAIKVLS